MRARRATTFATCLCVGTFLAGCVEIGVLGSPLKTFTGREILDLPVRRTDIIDVVADVDKPLGYSVSHLDRGAGRIGLSAEAAPASFLLIGKISYATLTVQTEAEGKRLAIDVTTMGNFGTGDQDAATRLVSQFKAKLLERLQP
jgi:hypothetical protein